jgi:transketolase
VLGAAPVKVAVEAAIRLGWDEFIGTDGAFVGMSGFGASAPVKDVYRHFGITAEAVVAAALKALGRDDAAGNIKAARRS